MGPEFEWTACEKVWMQSLDSSTSNMNNKDESQMINGELWEKCILYVAQ